MSGDEPQVEVIRPENVSTYSMRIVTIGSTRVPDRAGSQLARKPMPARIATTSAMVCRVPGPLQTGAVGHIFRLT